MSETKKTDRRVIKTKRAIRDALAALLARKDINAITVKDIAEEADINRKTFYSHYSGVHQVVEQIDDEIIEVFCSAQRRETDFTKVLRNPQELFQQLTDTINSDLEFYGNLLKVEGPSAFYYKLVDALKRDFKESFASQTNIEDNLLDIMMNYVVSGIISVFRLWFAAGQPIPIAEMSRTISTLTFQGINGLLNE